MTCDNVTVSECNDKVIVITRGIQGPPGSGTAGIFSLGLELPNELVVDNSPVTTSTGTISAHWQLQSPNLMFSSPDGISGVPSFRVITRTDLPTQVAYTDVANSWTIPQTVSVTVPFISISTNTTLTNNNKYVEVNSASANVTVTLPSAATPGLNFTIKKIAAANLLIIQPILGQTVDTQGTYTISNRFDAIQVVSNGAAWGIY